MPFLENLKLLLNNSDIHSEVHFKRPPTNNLLDFCDGMSFRMHSHFNSALLIITYYDELHSYVKKHKLGRVFFSLGNIRPQFRSSRKSIFLVALGKYQDIEEYGEAKTICQGYKNSVL